MADDNRPSADSILELLNGFRKSKVLFTLTSLNVPELIARSNQETLTASQLARLLARDAFTALPSLDGLGRLLDAAVSLGLLMGGREGYGLTDVARTYLCTGSEYSLVGYIIHSDQLLYKVCTCRRLRPVVMCELPDTCQEQLVHQCVLQQSSTRQLMFIL